MLLFFFYSFHINNEKFNVRNGSLKLDWREAEIFATLLCDSSKWSRTIYTYQRAAVMLMRKKDLTPSELQTIESLMR